mgnify:FL=1
MSKEKLALLIMAYGTPYKEEDIERYYTHIRHGRKPSHEEIDDLTERYRAIGGISPLAKITEAQAKSIEAKLNDMQDDYKFEMYIGLRHIEPFIEDAVEEIANDGHKKIVSLVLAPHYSTFSIKGYNERAKQAAEKHGLEITSVVDWYDKPGFIQYWVNAIEKVYHTLPEEEKEASVLIVSAHSLPEKIIADGDPYPKQLEETARLIFEKVSVPNYAVGWQSEGNTPDPWLGPDVQDLTRDLYKEKGYKAFIYAPVGFVSDHLEVLYDNDYECKVVCDEVGASYYRPEMPNTDELFIQTLAEVVLEQLT